MGQPLGHRPRQPGVLGQLASPGPASPPIGRQLGRPGPVGPPTPVAGDLALHRRGMAAQRNSRLPTAQPRADHLLDADTLLETKPPCHTGNLHRSVVAASPATMADRLQPPVELTGLLRLDRIVVGLMLSG